MPQSCLIQVSNWGLDMANSDIRLLTRLTNLNIISGRRCRRRSIPNDSLAPGANEDFIPDSGTWTGELYGSMEHTGENVEGGGMEGVYAWEWDQLYTDCAV